LTGTDPILTTALAEIVQTVLQELLEPRRRIDKVLWAVIMRAYITGTSTRTVDDLVRALGCDSGVSKSTVLRICKITTMSPSMSARAASRWTRG
jgi:hypothetical protein